MPDLDRILQAARQSMLTGRHVPHCYRAHVPGRGYINDGSRADWRQDYLRQLGQRVQAEINNLGYAPDYAEPGYSGSEPHPRGILFANWSVFPRGFDRTLERAGYAVEWSDEWTTCEDCQKAFRTSPDSYVWEPAGLYCEDCQAELCHACHAEAHETDTDDED